MPYCASYIPHNFSKENNQKPILIFFTLTIKKFTRETSILPTQEYTIKKLLFSTLFHYVSAI